MSRQSGERLRPQSFSGIYKSSPNHDWSGLEIGFGTCATCHRIRIHQWQGRKRSKASGTEKTATTAEKASEPEKGEKRKQAEGGRSGKSGGRAGKRKGHGGATTTTKAQHSTSHAQAGPGSINKYPAELE